MAPAFSSTKQTAGFALLLLLIILAPLLVRKSLLPPREEIYTSLGWVRGNFPYMQREIFERKDDIDIAFMGYSRMMWGIDAPEVQAQLCRKLGRKSTVTMFGWTKPGFDAFYFTLKDLIEHRKVRMIVFPDLRLFANDYANPLASSYFRMADDAEDLAGVGFRPKLSFYADAVLGMPRCLLGRLRADLPAIPVSQFSLSTVLTNIETPMWHMGSMLVRAREDQPFCEFNPKSEARPQDVRVYSEGTKQDFQFSTKGIDPMSMTFARKVGALAKENGIRLVYLHMPLSDDLESPTIEEPVYWPDCLGYPVTMVGIAPGKLFAGMKREDALKMFYNLEHLNQNGQRYFTRVVAPSLFQIYSQP